MKVALLRERKSVGKIPVMELTSKDASQSKGREVDGQDGGHSVLCGL